MPHAAGARRRAVGFGPTLRPLVAWLLATALLSGACRHAPDPHSHLWTEIDACDTIGWAHAVHLSGGKVYLADRRAGFLVFDRTVPLGPPARFAPVEDAIAVAPQAGGTLVAARFEGLVSVGPAGGVTGRLPLGGDIANAVRTRGGLAFAAFGLHGLVVARIVRGALGLAASLPTRGWSHDVELVGERALLADWEYGLRIIDVADPEKPTELAVVPTPATAIAVAVTRTAAGSAVAAVAEGHGGVALVDVTDPVRPVSLGRADLGLRPSDPAHPPAGGWAHGVAWWRDLIFVANWKDGVAVVQARDPRAPGLIARIPSPGTALGVAVDTAPDGAARIWLAAGEAGLRVLRFAGN